MTVAWDPVRKRMRYLPDELGPLVRHVERLGVERLARRMYEDHPATADLLRVCAGVE